MPSVTTQYFLIGEGPLPAGDTAGPHRLTINIEPAFDAIYELWREIALALQEQPTAELAHMPTMSIYASDFGVMLAWLRVVEGLVKDTTEDALSIVCSDPWLFRAIALIPGVTAGAAPGIVARRLRLGVRGLLARTLAALRCLSARWRTRRHRHNVPSQASWLLVYGHPESNARGFDAYFGNLMTDFPDLQRLMHTDCGPAFAIKLSADGRTRSLHAWGNYRTAMTLAFHRWKPDTSGLDAKVAWIVKRAAAIEGSGGSAAMTHWQSACQAAWLQEAGPKAVCWPWENHPWERDLVRRSRPQGISTLGYQHTVVGRHMYNQGEEANRDGLASIPDRIILNGTAYGRDLQSRGIPESRMRIGGSHRFNSGKLPRFEKDGAVFLALSSNAGFTEQMIAATRPLASATLPFIVKDHPLSPYAVTESAHFSYTRAAIADLPPVRALVYCTGTTGLEGLLAGIPTVRFIPEGNVAPDILPAGMHVTTSNAETLSETLNNLPAPKRYDATILFPPPDKDIWKTLLDLTKSTDQKP